MGVFTRTVEARAVGAVPGTAMIDATYLLTAQSLLGDRGEEVDWFRDALEAKSIKPCIPRRKSRNAPVRQETRRNRIEITFGCLKDRRRAATPGDRRPVGMGWQP